MAVSLIDAKVGNVIISESPELIVPVIIAMVDWKEGDPTPSNSDINALNEMIYASLKTQGITSDATLAWWNDTSQITPAIIATIPTGEHTYGTTLKIRVNKGSNNQIQNVKFIYNDYPWYNSPTYTGNASYEYVYSVIYIDNDFNVLVGNGEDESCLYVLANALADRVGTVNNQVLTASIEYGESGNYRLRTLGNPVNFQRTLFNLLEYLEENPFVPPGPTPGEDPYEPGGETDTGGGTGDFDNTSIAIEIPQPPPVTVDNTGFISLYSPTMVELRALASYLWSSSFDLDTFKKIFSDPISTILGLTIVPVAPGLDASRTVILGNINTGVVMQKVSNQYIRFDCGTLNITEYWGGYLDYSPYTRAEIYLPFIGTKPINIDDIMGKSVHLVYNIDLLSGACCAMLECGGTVLYSFVGQCASSIPVTGNDMTQVINGILSVVGAGAGTFVRTQNPGLSAISAVGSLASNVSNMKSHVEKSGSLGGAAGMLGVRTPYLILTRPKQALPAAQNIFTGYPSYISGILGDFSGYTEVQTVHLRETSATQEEKAEIERLLKEGVII